MAAIHLEHLRHSYRADPRDSVDADWALRGIELKWRDGGGPGNATTLLSIDLVKIALGQFDLGPAAAMSLIYFLIILLLSWLFYTVMTKDDEA